MFRVEIVGNHLEETQIWWQNFIEYMFDTYGHSEDNILEPELKKFHAIMEINFKTDDLDALLFEDEKHYTAFLLKWS